jgi:hypothetical protein
MTLIRFAMPAREFKSVIEQGGPSAPLAPLGDPGDKLRDSVAFALADLGHALDLHEAGDERFDVSLTLAGSRLALFINPVPKEKHGGT